VACRLGAYGVAPVWQHADQQAVAAMLVLLIQQNCW
jgi:hypothetical protein